MQRSNNENFPPWRSARLPLLLANERTFLAWIRTALGFLAAGLGLINLRQISPRPSFVNCCVVVVSVFRRVSDVWLPALVRNEKAMRLKEDLPYTNSLLILA